MTPVASRGGDFLAAKRKGSTRVGLFRFTTANCAGDNRAIPMPTARAPRQTHHVYVVLLDDRVWNEHAFRKANPDHALARPCVYVGMTGLDPDLRFDKHKAGIQSNRFVFKYGLRLLPALYAVYNPMPYEAAREMEVELAIGLREAGYGVWQA
jgi:hypothetical protein